MHIGAQLQIWAFNLQRRARREDGRGIHKFEIRVRGQESLHLRFVLFPQDAAGGVDQPSARCDAARGTGKDPGLQRCQFGETLLILAPFQVRIAPQRTDAAAGRIDQYALRFARQTAYARIILILDGHGTDVG